MCKKRSFSALGAGLCILACAAPLMAQSADGPGVTVDLGGAMLMHRPAVAYPAAALARQVEGTVSVQATLDAKGNVTDAHVVGGPEELRKTALLSVLDWHFANASAGATRQVSITFLKPPPVNQPASPMGPVSLGMLLPGAGSGGPVGAISQQTAIVARSAGPRTVKSIAVYGLPDQLKNDLISSLPVHVGDVLTVESTAKLMAAVKQYGEHLSVGTSSQAGETEIRISAPGAGMLTGIPGILAAPAAPQASPVPGDVPQATPLRRVMPVYPPEARQIRLQGVVRLKAVVAKDGTVQSLTVVSGHPLLVQPALDAAKQWLYKPTLLNGQPVEAATDIEINFTLADAPPQQ